VFMLLLFPRICNNDFSGLHVPVKNSFKPWQLNNRCPHIVAELQNIA
jgi:hypothetical protein